MSREYLPSRLIRACSEWHAMEVEGGPHSLAAPADSYGTQKPGRRADCGFGAVVGFEYDVPSVACMLVEVQPGYLHRASGPARLHAAFKDV